VNDASATAASVTSEVGALREQIAGLTTELQGRNDEIDAADAAKAQMEEQIAALEAQLADLTGDAEQQANALLASATSKEALEAELAALQTEMESVRGAREAAAAQASSLEEDLSASTIELAAANDNAAAASARVAELEAELASLTEDGAATASRLSAATSQTDALQRQLAALRENAGDVEASLQSELEAARAEIAAANAKAEEDSAAAEAALEAMKAEADEAEARGDALAIDLDALRADLAASEERATRFGTMLSEDPTREQLDATVARLTDISNTANELQESNIELARRLEEANAANTAALDSLREEITATQADRAVRLGAMQSRMAELRIENRDLQNELAILAAAPPQVIELAPERDENSDALRDGLINALGSDAIINPDGSLSLSSSATFASGSATLSGEGQRVLGNVAGEMVNFLNNRPDVPGVIVVEGHTDADPIATARFPSNWALSATRAANVVNFLISRGVPADRIKAEAYAATQPIDLANTREAFAKNRRIFLLGASGEKAPCP